MAKFSVNGKTYLSRPVDFNMVCTFEDMGLTFTDIEKKTTSFIRAYLAICGNMTVERAGKEIEEHIMIGGDMGEIANALLEEVNESDFFRALSKNKEETITETQSATTKKK